MSSEHLPPVSAFDVTGDALVAKLLSQVRQEQRGAIDRYAEEALKEHEALEGAVTYRGMILEEADILIGGVKRLARPFRLPRLLGGSMVEVEKFKSGVYEVDTYQTPPLLVAVAEPLLHRSGNDFNDNVRLSQSVKLQVVPGKNYSTINVQAVSTDEVSGASIDQTIYNIGIDKGETGAEAVQVGGPTFDRHKEHVLRLAFEKCKSGFPELEDLYFDQCMKTGRMDLSTLLRRMDLHTLLMSDSMYGTARERTYDEQLDLEFKVLQVQATLHAARAADYPDELYKEPFGILAAANHELGLR